MNLLVICKIIMHFLNNEIVQFRTGETFEQLAGLLEWLAHKGTIN